MPLEGQAASQAVDSIVQHVYPILAKVSQSTDVRGQVQAYHAGTAHSQPNVDPQLASELLQILADVYNRFPHIISTSTQLQSTSVTALLSILSSGRLNIRKRAIPALGALISNNPTLFDQVKPHVSQGLAAGGDAAKVWANVLASLARGLNASKVGVLVNEANVVELVLAQTEDPEETDMVEGALVVSRLFAPRFHCVMLCAHDQALEVLVIRCPTEMSPYVTGLTEKVLELVRYDPVSAPVGAG